MKYGVYIRRSALQYSNERILSSSRRVGSQSAKQWLDRLQREKIPVLVCLTFADKFYAEHMTEDGQHPKTETMKYHLEDQLIVSQPQTGNYRAHIQLWYGEGEYFALISFCSVHSVIPAFFMCRRLGGRLVPLPLTRSSSSPSLRTGTLSLTHPMADGGWRRLALAAPGMWGHGW